MMQRGVEAGKREERRRYCSSGKQQLSLLRPISSIDRGVLKDMVWIKKIMPIQQ